MKTSIFSIALLILISCSNEHTQLIPFCHDQDPVEIPQWLENEIREHVTTQLEEYSYVMEYNIDGTKLFYFGNCCPFCYYLPIVYNCQGEVLEFDDELIELLNNNKGIIIAWGESFVCQF